VAGSNNIGEPKADFLEGEGIGQRQRSAEALKKLKWIAW